MGEKGEGSGGDGGEVGGKGEGTGNVVPPVHPLIIIRHLVTSPFKSMYFQISCKNYCRKTIEATVLKKSANRKQIDIRIIHFYCSFLVSVVFCMIFI